MDYRMKKSSLRILCLFLNFMMLMPFFIFFIAAIFSGVNPLFSVLMLFLLILPLANFFHIYYKKRKNLLLKNVNFIAAVFFGIVMIGSVGNTNIQDSMKLIVVTIFLIFNINYVYISGGKKFWLNSDE